MTKILMFSGQIGSGKGYVSSKMINEIKEVGNTIIYLSFANPIKKLIDSICGFDKNLKYVPSDGVYDNEEEFYSVLINGLKNHLEFCDIEFDFVYNTSLKELYDNYQIVINTDLCDEVRKNAIRKMYQIYGTDIMQRYNICIWSIYLSKVVEQYKEVNFIIIDDWRFLFELFALTTLLPNYQIEEYAIYSKPEVRAKRRNITVEELEKQCQHLSEVEFEKLIMPWMRLRKPDNIIEN